MTRTPPGIGRMSLVGTDGEVLSASTDNRTYLQFREDPLGGTARAKVHVVRPPAAVLVNGSALPKSNWAYDASERAIALKGLPSGTVLLRFSGP
jgi:sulfur carrier protein ThiS